MSPEAAPDRSGITIRPLRGPADLDACVRLQRLTWGEQFTEYVPATTLDLVAGLGGVLAGAFSEDGTLLGFVFGLVGLDGDRVIHWSDMLGVHPAARDRGIGEALKWYQREAVLARGIGLVRWTFDPLESRNAYFNIRRLGATACRYVRDRYPASDSPLHQGIGTDRLVASWTLGSERVARRAAGERPPPTDWTAAPPVLAPAAPDGDDPEPAVPDLAVNAPAVRIAVPADIQKLKRDDPGRALHWREATRTAFEHCFARGYITEDFARGENVGWYILRNPDLPPVE